MTKNNQMYIWYYFLSLTLIFISLTTIIPFAWGYTASILTISLIGVCYICYQAITEEICDRNIWVRK